MAQTLIRFDTPVTYRDGRQYRAQACGRERENGQWEAWLEFEDIDIGRDTALAARNDAAQSDGRRLLGDRSHAGVSGGCARSHPPSAEATRRLNRVPPPFFDGPAPRRRAAVLESRADSRSVLGVREKPGSARAGADGAAWMAPPPDHQRFRSRRRKRCAARDADRAGARIAHHAARARATSVSRLLRRRSCAR